MLDGIGREIELGLAATAFALGLRHGVDWDHLAAVSDLASGQGPRRARALGMLYFVGHAAAVLALGLVVVAAGGHLPDRVDAVMERLVGVTLVMLGFFVAVDLLRNGAGARPRSRWTLVLAAIRRLRRRRRPAPETTVIEHDHAHRVDEVHGHDLTHVHSRVPVGAGAVAQEIDAVGPADRQLHRHPHRHVLVLPEDPLPTVSGRGAFAIGMLHGVGVETPTQILVLVGAAGAGVVTGVSVLLAFVAGLWCTNAVRVVGAAAGLAGSRHRRLRVALTATVAGLSLALGAVLLLGQGAALPVLFA